MLDEIFLLTAVESFKRDYSLDDPFIEILSGFKLTYLIDINIAPWLVWESLERHNKSNVVCMESMFSKDLAYCLGCEHDDILVYCKNMGSRYTKEFKRIPSGEWIISSKIVNFIFQKSPLKSKIGYLFKKSLTQYNQESIAR